MKMWSITLEVENNTRKMYINGETVSKARDNFYKSDTYRTELINKNFKIKEIIDPDCACR